MAPRKYASVVACILISTPLLFSESVFARTMVPKLDQEGRQGDVARIAKEKAVQRFNAYDKDGDGRLSRSEVEQASAYLAEAFPVRDSDGDGFLSWDEFVGHDRWEK